MEPERGRVPGGLFEPDGSCVIRTYYRVPQPGDGELGALFDAHLPER